MKHSEIVLTPDQRRIVEQAVEEVCRFRGWALEFVNCRSNHIHVVVRCGDIPADPVMNQFKSYATRALRDRGFFPESRVWTRGGSKRKLFKEAAVVAAFNYVEHQ